MPVEVRTRSEWDRVYIVAGATEIMLPYAAALSVAQHARLAARSAMRMVHEDVSKWRDYAEVRETGLVLPNATPRRTLGGRFEWSIDLKDWDERVYFRFGNLELVLHFEKALQLAADLRASAREAKAWAGDRSKGMRAAGRLTDAEKNYKHGWI